MSVELVGKTLRLRSRMRFVRRQMGRVLARLRARTLDAIQPAIVLDVIATTSLQLSNQAVNVVGWCTQKDLHTLLCSAVDDLAILAWFVTFVLVAFAARSKARELRQRLATRRPDVPARH